MIPGLNTELTRRGRTVHVQTEAHGLNPIELVTHIFVGGTVVHTVRTHALPVPHSNASKDVAQQMRHQHRMVHHRASQGQFDRQLLAQIRLGHSDIPLAKERPKSNGQREE